ncbi:gamma carbonic anhydrase family protein [Mobilicoccus caccae]|uniref:Gamma carbonic anhydrase family protein n=1 Tax=Mobilicoccus caccae TaxID=1859295 RepID=A0ABQ6IW88_9MICO|nr:gamma carbonic anhydrase family protein [Mobilicoccus caccae]GMA42219.1 gamma carbonic anhydrase family protein [Mobilicoccus caccae]
MLISLDGRAPEVAGDAWTAPTAVAIGAVTVGSQASLWFGAVARGDGDEIRIGARSNVQDNAVLHADPGFPALIGEDVTIGHNATVHGCTLEDRVIVGMGAIVMNGARVGSDSIVAAGTLVLEGVTIPPRSLVVGAPGKVRRELTDDELAKVRRNAEVYVEKAQTYRTGATTL